MSWLVFDFVGLNGMGRKVGDWKYGHVGGSIVWFCGWMGE